MTETNPLPFHPQADIIDQILKEVKHSKQVMDYWPDHVVAKAALVSWEAGQLEGYSLTWKYERAEGPLTIQAQHDRMIRSAIKTAAMAIRFLETLPPISSPKTIKTHDTTNSTTITAESAEDLISQDSEREG